MSVNIDFQKFEDRAAASAAAANLLAGLLRDVLDSAPRAEASLVVSGGTTPGPCFDLLSGEPLDWSRVTVMPSDERWVPATDAASNERLIRTRLLKGPAAAGKMLPFFREGLDASQAPSVIEAELARLSREFSAVLLGMGEDGHFASLFPDFDGLQDALDPQSGTTCTLVRTASSPYTRISLTLPVLLKSVHIALLIFGESKRSVFETAMSGSSTYPITALLRETRTPLTVIWAP
ncbi:MAG: 6-phosphogluconolactonase [Lysobacterales bacterium]